MRVLLIGSAKPWRLEASLERAFRRAGHSTLLLDDRRMKQRVGRALTQRWMLRSAARFGPDFVFLSKCLALDLDTVERVIRGRANAMWFQDPPWYTHVSRPDIAHIAAVGRLSAVFFVTGFEAEWRELGLPARFLPAAADRDIAPVPPDPAFAADVTFIGTGYDPTRAAFLQEVARHARLRIWGGGWEPWAHALDWGGRPIEGGEFAAACSSSAIVLGILPAVARGSTTYASDRMWLTTLAGGFFLGAGTPGADRLLLDGMHCAWYTDLPSCIQQIRHYLANSDERERIRANGERFVREHHTFDQRICNLLAGEPFVNPLDVMEADVGRLAPT